MTFFEIIEWVTYVVGILNIGVAHYLWFRSPITPRIRYEDEAIALEVGLLGGVLPICLDLFVHFMRI